MAESWYVLRVRFGFEALVVSELRKQDIPALLPLHQNAGTFASTVTTVALPGHVFARFAFDDRHVIDTIPGVLCVAGAPSALPVSESDISAIEAAVNAGLPIRVLPLSTSTCDGRVTAGPLRGRQGLFLERNGQWHFAICVEAIERVFAFEVPEESVEFSYRQRTMR
jgi:hypothetical protein